MVGADDRNHDLAMDADDMDEWLWPNSCAELRQMESSLRCLICGDFFHGPVLLPCTHTFCSECVRRFLQSRGASGCCPECKQPCAPRDLVPNRSLEKVGVLFQQMKPKMLPLLSTSKSVTECAAKTTPMKAKGTGADSKPPERMPLLSYSVMKEKDIKKLLESIGIRAVVKNRDDIIQIHKEYVLLANAQADSSHPKSVKQVREEVLRNYRARQQERMSGRKSSESASGPPVISAEMQVGFERLRQQVKARKEKQTELQNDTEGRESRDEELDEEENDPPAGEWRHVRALQSNQDFYIHSSTHEIRLEPPSEYLELQLRRGRENDETRKGSHALTDNDDEVTIIGTSRATGESEARVVANDDDDDDFVMNTSPPPKPPLRSRIPTPQSSRKLRQSFGTPTVASGSGRFSQSPSCATGIQETATQHESSASLPLDDYDVLSTTQSTAETLNKWECPRCTLVNEGPGLVECEACGYQHRPARKKQKLQFQRTIMSSLSQH